MRIQCRVYLERCSPGTRAFPSDLLRHLGNARDPQSVASDDSEALTKAMSPIDQTGSDPECGMGSGECGI